MLLIASLAVSIALFFAVRSCVDACRTTIWSVETCFTAEEQPGAIDLSASRQYGYRLDELVAESAYMPLRGSTA